MATAEQLRAEFTSYMDQQGVKYRVTNDEDNIVRLSFAGRDSKGGGADTTIFVDFDENGDDAGSVHFVAHKFASCTMQNYPTVLVKLNEFNARFRWVKFYVIEDGGKGYLTADSDAMLVAGAAAFECVASCFRMSDIVEDAIVELGDLIEPDDGKDELRAMLAALRHMLGE